MVVCVRYRQGTLPKGPQQLCKDVLVCQPRLFHFFIYELVISIICFLLQYISYIGLLSATGDAKLEGEKVAFSTKDC